VIDTVQDSGTFQQGLQTGALRRENTGDGFHGVKSGFAGFIGIVRSVIDVL
jgi:hypothetical protein